MQIIILCVCFCKKCNRQIRKILRKFYKREKNKYNTLKILSENKQTNFKKNMTIPNIMNRACTLNLIGKTWKLIYCNILRT